MYVKLTLQEKLKDERTSRHMTLADLEKATGISHSALGKYESDDCTDISPFNLAKLAEFYGVSMDYLMGLTENRRHENTPLSEIHLNDETVDLLKSGRINNRLLCEIVCHPAFPRLLTDIEVCVDRIADMHIQDMNLLLEQARQKIIKKGSPGENDLPMRTLELAKVDEDIFYSHVIHDDLDEVVKDIRSAHEKDRTTADGQAAGGAVMDDIIPMLQEALDYEGTSDEKRAFLVCRMLDIKYDRLSDDDRNVLARILKRSPKLQNVISQRGKASPQMSHGKGKRRKK